MARQWRHVDGTGSRSASVKERGLSTGVRARAVEGVGRLKFDARVLGVPHQGVLLRGGSVARHLSALFEGAWCGRATTRKGSIS
jgi:hypothetical protein